MGNFIIEIHAVGGHGQDRAKKDGEVVDFTEGGKDTPDAIAKKAVDALVKAGVSVSRATVVHWPGTKEEVSDDLLTGKRTGNF